MERSIITQLAQWKEKENRKPLVLKGARQVGKTWTLKDFGRQYFKKTAYVTFFKNQRMKDVFEGDYDIERILTNIGIECKLEVTPQDTLIIFDEIQECPRAMESLKYFCKEHPEYAVCAAGSLLGIALHTGVSFPVGKVDTLEMYPLNARDGIGLTADTKASVLQADEEAK
mgnify:CR=1 FL=1